MTGIVETTWPNGETQFAGIIGDPIAQVKSPAAVTAEFRDRGLNWALMPLHVSAEDLPSALRGLDVLRNFSGLIATVPHKFAAFRHCKTATARATLLQAANVARRNPDNSWHGDMVDGLGFVNALSSTGFVVAGQRSLVVGAGGAGTAIAHALLEAGAAAVSVYDRDPKRADALSTLLCGVGRYDVSTSPAPDPRGHTLIVNATPAGMHPDDPLPIMAEHLVPNMTVADVITAPEVTPLLETARNRGCVTQTGAAMYFGLLNTMVDFITQAEGGDHHT